ncbi:MAG: 2-C-methyl-D-erythritol 2,4-cyclodiphosphate synthase [Acidimicrobiales bacterium]
MSEMRIGLGVDVHRFAPPPTAGAGVAAGVSPDTAPGEARSLVLGGVAFPGERPLVGHSDADAVAHSVADAILGAAALGDLGAHFPDSDVRWRGADSLELLAQCAALARHEGWQLVNADCTIVAERPRLAPASVEMAVRLSAAAGGPVHVKATRPEGLGSLGRVEGLACFAVALLGRGGLSG